MTHKHWPAGSPVPGGQVFVADEAVQAEVGLAAAVGAVVACGAAVAASPLMPIGPARLAEPHPGLSADIPVLAAGSGAIVALILAGAAWPAWRQAAARLPAERGVARVPGRRPGAVAWLARSGAPVTAVTGVRLVFDPGHGRGPGPARSALAGLALSATAVAAAVAFGANLLHLVQTPRLYGQDWDVSVELQFGTITPQRFDAIAARVPASPGGPSAFTARWESAAPSCRRSGWPWVRAS
jgi:hypothetical protein